MLLPTSKQQSQAWQIRRRRGILIAAAALCSHAAHASTFTWTGGGANPSWTLPANWGGVAPSPGDALLFDGANTTNVNNFAASTTFLGITFGAVAGSFTLTGNPFTLGTPL